MISFSKVLERGQLELHIVSKKKLQTDDAVNFAGLKIECDGYEQAINISAAIKYKIPKINNMLVSAQGPYLTTITFHSIIPNIKRGSDYKLNVYYDPNTICDIYAESISTDKYLSSQLEYPIFVPNFRETVIDIPPIGSIEKIYVLPRKNIYVRKEGYSLSLSSNSANPFTPSLVNVKMKLD